MELRNYTVDTYGSMYFQKTNDAPMRKVFCPYDGKPLFHINYQLIELTNSAGITLETANRELIPMLEWRCRNCRVIWMIYLR